MAGFTTVKDICWYALSMCHYGRIVWDSQIRDVSILIALSQSLGAVQVVIMTILSALTIYTLKRSDPDRDLARQNIRRVGVITKLERKLVVVGVITSVAAIVSEIAGPVGFYSCHSMFSNVPTCLSFAFGLFILNNVFNIPIYLWIFHAATLCACPMGNKSPSDDRVPRENSSPPAEQANVETYEEAVSLNALQKTHLNK